ncbi:hypothetical protein AVEN_146748-1 [Araneus ventricosus]|uniref:Uncharacterized protein n=1 Tax=Araneus ventricosus TaxID=182803 RepID=A0A4Y2Q4S9_ARAVE|nr:hypothetical protein AVEN_146748-1 [Araneus ventricosus]
MLLQERENIRITAQLEEKHAIIETHVRENIIRIQRLIGELVPAISGEIREKFVHEVSKKTKQDNDKLVNEINSEKILTKTFTQVMNSQSTHESGRNITDNDWVLIVKPKEVDDEILMRE